jgi:hypothetical protein
VILIGSAGINGSAVTEADGTYVIPDLPTGSYRATFVDPSGSGLAQEYWDGSPDYGGADVFSVDAGATTTIDADLNEP